MYFATVSLADFRYDKSGRFFLVIGVGTVIIKTLASLMKSLS